MTAQGDASSKSAMNSGAARVAFTEPVAIGAIHPDVRRAVIRGDLRIVKEAADAGLDLASALELALQLPATRTEVLEFLCNDPRVTITGDAVAFALSRAQLRRWVKVLQKRAPSIDTRRSVAEVVQEQLAEDAPAAGHRAPVFCVPAIAKAVDLASGAALKTLHSQGVDLAGALAHALYHNRAPDWLLKQMLYELELPATAEAAIIAARAKPGTLGQRWSGAVAAACQPGLNLTEFFRSASAGAMKGILRNPNYCGVDLVQAMALSAPRKAENLALLRYALGKFPKALAGEGLLPAVVSWKDSAFTSQVIRDGAPVTARAVRALAMTGDTRLLKLVLSTKYDPSAIDFEEAVRFGLADRLTEIVDAYVKAGCYAHRRTFSALAERWASKDNWDIDGQTIFRRLVKPLPVSYQKAVTRLVMEAIRNSAEEPGRHLAADLQWLEKYAPKEGDAWRPDDTYSLGVYSMARREEAVPSIP